MSWDALVVGGGAAGMMAAGTAAERGLRVCLLEKNAVLGRKLRITGKGRCNVTNRCDVRTLIASVPKNGRFLFGAVSRFAPEDTVAFFESRGLPLKTERGNRVFPVSDRAADVAECLEKYVRESGARVTRGEAERLLLENGAVRGVALKDGREIPARSVAVCCGGASYPSTGSTGAGYRLARQAGHTVTPLRPSLVPLVARGRDCREMMGLSLRNVAVAVTDTALKKAVYRDFGELLFTHFGLSGPVILSASAHMDRMAPGRYRVSVDLKPALSPEKLDARLVRDFGLNRNREFCNSLSALLPRKMIPVAVRRSGIPPDTRCNAITREMRRGFGELLKSFEIEIEGFRPIEEAIVTSGGVSTDEIDPRTMESRLVKGLYFAGEVVDVDAYTGGFNLQIAFSTGRAAGKSMEAEET
ncbi:MAG TPA: aminoacetone oxidase family FAD-binding enzyme [Ruminococcaceae bacterium]|nr:aminoacetone oxidase family FAD-binding enzyme [Oscillospiraceae bacterium]HBG55251.1 aminoacetone oxidase family FAD-binding enzyme [Oscillospiraceae bacterium]HBQ46346.1 aminoacetone oxidase family FAD-binding enzyme [Oscillospiraceae bacterium]HBT90281.1 aminoacetone oxidase family FAD-binding enzyme [Oscillospiraceae bacterium]HCB91307.1 aminoacetone oxidase family FAD-binding enzyme [Oscillospiraceae bacterium]